MNRREALNGCKALGFVAVLALSALCVSSQAGLSHLSRLAVIDLGGDEGRVIGGLLSEIASKQGLNGPIELVDQQQVASAVQGSAYGGSLNLSLREARDLGMSIGCEYFVVGKVIVGRRVGPIGTEAGSGASYYVGLMGLFLVDGRSGRLAAFAFEQVDGKSEDEARKRLIAKVGSGWSRLQEGIRIKERVSSAATTEDGLIIDLDDPSKTSSGLVLPVFYERVKPQYTDQARLAGITATVELKAVFRDTGHVTDLEIVRWAGFGLDESALQTAAGLRFKPAERNGQPISVRALLRYNFKG